MSKQHYNQQTQAMNNVKEIHMMELQAALADTKDEAGQQYSMATRDIIERLGKEGRDALEAQRILSERARMLDLDRTTADNQMLLSTHASSMLYLEKKLKDTLSTALEEQKIDLEGVLKQSIHEKEKGFERTMEAYMVSQGIEKDSALNTLRTQHEVKLDKQWTEITQLREVALEAEMRHQKDLSIALEEHLLELSAQRAQLVTMHGKDMDVIKEQLLQAKEKYREMASAGSDRNSSDMKALRAQRDEFDGVLQSSMEERDNHHKQIIKTLCDNQEAEKIRLAASSEKDEIRFEADIDQLKRQHLLEVQKVEAMWKEKINKELSAGEEIKKQLLDVEGALKNANTASKEEIRVMQLQYQNVEEALKAANILNTQQQKDLSISIVKLRAQHESEKLELLGVSNTELLALEQRDRELLETNREDGRVREDALNADFKNILISLNVSHDKDQADALAQHTKISDDFNSQLQGLERAISEERALLTEARGNA
jgi:hypothetical protein